MFNVRTPRKHDKTSDHSRYWGRLFRSMFSLLQILTFDAWITDVLRPILDVLPLTAQLIDLS